ncbi:MAG TPA: tetratricopeptide repeat protein, partial [Desulfomicrobiaceae bacterium]|nr:tetratricopeptide repeat protein [Desulfomicrobiaceae bacterium]
MHTPLWAVIRSLPLALSLLLAGCAFGRPVALSSSEPAPEWNLSGEARNIFLHLKADNLIRSKDAVRAIPVLEQLVSAVPTSDGYRQLASLYWNQGDLLLARQTLKKGMDLFPDSPELVLLLGRSYLAEKRLDDAVVTIRDYLADHPEEWSMYENLGALLIDAHEYAAALDNLERIPVSSRTPRGLFLLGKAGAELGLTD